MRKFLGKQYRILRGRLQSAVYNTQHKGKEFDLLILDDFFPNPVSSFRFTEFNHYFQKFDKIAVMTTGKALLVVNEPKKISQFINTYNQAYPLRTVSMFDGRKKPFAKICYTVFLNNAFNFLPYIEKHKLDFVFCLYPGGGFNLGMPETDEKLKAVCSSPYFKGVIATQKNTCDYLLDNKYCTEDKICYIFGGILAIHQYPMTKDRAYYGFPKKTLDICFMANKYMKGGIDKGFDVFAAVAKQLEKFKDICFHVVGPYSAEDIEGKVAKNITFHGSKLTEALNPFFDEMDIIVSPNRPFVLNKGAFDGFPTGSCVEASLKGVAMFITDPLQLNTVYQNKEHIEIIEPNIEEVAEKIIYYHANPEALRTLATKGQKQTRYLFSNDIQLSHRVAFLNEKLDMFYTPLSKKAVEKQLA
jgi:glycosyltransferase involved in cell wall biosynthesis